MAQPEMTDPQKGAEPDYKVERPKPKMTRQQRLGMGALLVGASLAALWTVWPSSRAIPDVETSAVEEFQDQAGGSPFGAIEPGPGANPASDGFPTSKGNWPHSARTSKRGTPHSSPRSNGCSASWVILPTGPMPRRIRPPRNWRLRSKRHSRRTLLSWRTCGGSSIRRSPS
jgi:hypothetical protein